MLQAHIADMGRWPNWCPQRLFIAWQLDKQAQLEAVIVKHLRTQEAREEYSTHDELTFLEVWQVYRGRSLFTTGTSICRRMMIEQ